MGPRALLPAVPGIASVMKQHAPAALIAAFLAAWSLPSAADSPRARCEIYPKGSDKLETMVPCTFGQRQGHITITREDGVSEDLSPVGRLGYRHSPPTNLDQCSIPCLTSWK